MPGFFPGIRQYTISLTNLLKTLFCITAAAIFIGMIAQCKLSVGSFNFGLCGSLT